MAMEVLTVRGILALKSRTKRYEVFDALTPSLAIRVTPSGHKSWALYYRHHGRQRRLTLGRYPDLTLADARSQAIHERGRILKGADPATEKQAGHAENDHTVQALYELSQPQGEGPPQLARRRERSVAHLRSLRSNSRVMRKQALGDAQIASRRPGVDQW
jgi:hypothetical protein